MGWFRQLLTGLHRRRVWILDGAGDFCCDVAGERYCQRALDRLAGGKTEHGHWLQTVAELVPDRAGGAEPGDVLVLIDHARVGHLAKPHAAVLIRALRIRGVQSARADALIVGGWSQKGMRGRQGDYFVRLDLPSWLLDASSDGDPDKDSRSRGQPLRLDGADQLSRASTA